jgi:acetyltransferase-like isoleucine patch superfamily enzyme
MLKEQAKEFFSNKMEEFVGIRPWQILKCLQRCGNWIQQCGNGVQQWSIWPNKVRHFLLRSMGAKLANTAIVVDQVYVYNPRNLTMGHGTYINTRCFIDGNGPVTLGDWVRLGPYVRILTGTHEYNPRSVYRRRNTRDIVLPVTIERGSWIGTGTTIMPGVTIREGCVVGANSLLLQSTKPNSLYVGNPARFVRKLGTEETGPEDEICTVRNAKPAVGSGYAVAANQ